MPNPLEICTIVAGGQRYDNWETVEVSHNVMQVVDHVMLTVSEISTKAVSWASLKLKPGDSVQVLLAGEAVVNGWVYLRQATTDTNSHSVQIGIASPAQEIVASTVETKPGIYKNQSAQQIGSALAGKMGVGFSIAGNPPGGKSAISQIRGARRRDDIQLYRKNV